MFTPQQEKRIKEIIQEVLHERIANDLDKSVLKFFKTIPDMQNHFVTTTYDAYVDFCDSHNFVPVTKTSFGLSVRSYYNVKSKVTTFDGKSVRVYTR